MSQRIVRIVIDYPNPEEADLDGETSIGNIPGLYDTASLLDEASEILVTKRGTEEILRLPLKPPSRGVLP